MGNNAETGWYFVMPCGEAIAFVRHTAASANPDQLVKWLAYKAQCHAEKCKLCAEHPENKKE